MTKASFLYSPAWCVCVPAINFIYIHICIIRSSAILNGPLVMKNFGGVTAQINVHSGIGVFFSSAVKNYGVF